MAGPFVAYYRVSTEGQGRSGLGLDAQREAVARFIASDAGTALLGEFTEVESGRKADRPQLAAALALARRRKATLVIAKLDRLARSVAFIAQLMEGDVPFVACDARHATSLTIHILAAVAQHEREAISKRTKDALAEARKRLAAKGKRLGNVKNLAEAGAKGSAAASAEAARFRSGVAPLVLNLRAEGRTLREVAAELNERRVATPRGRRWHAATVRGVLAQHG